MVIYVLRNEKTVRTTPEVNGDWLWIPAAVSFRKAGFYNLTALSNIRHPRSWDDRSSNGKDKYDGNRYRRSRNSRSRSRSRDSRSRSRSRYRRSRDSRSRDSRSRSRDSRSRGSRSSYSRSNCCGSRERGNDRYHRNRNDARGNSRSRECRNDRYYRNRDEMRSNSRNNRDDRTRQSPSAPNSHRQIGAATTSTFHRSSSRPHLPDHHRKFHKLADFKIPKKEEERQEVEHSGSHGTGDQFPDRRGNPPGTGNAHTRRVRNYCKRKEAEKAQAVANPAATDTAAVYPVVANPNDVELVKIEGVLSMLSCNQDDTADIAAERAINTVPGNLDFSQNEVMKRSGQRSGALLKLDQQLYAGSNSAQNDTSALMSAPRIKVEPKEEIIDLIDDNQNELENIKPVLESIKRKDAAVLEAAAAAAAGTNGAEGFSQ